MPKDAKEILKILGKMKCNFSSIESGGIEDIQKHRDAIELEFMRKSRFVKIKGKFSEIVKEADEIIESAEDNDILMLKLYVLETQILVIGVKVVNEDDYIDLVFGD